MNGARLESSTVKYTLSLVSPQSDVCGSIVVKWQKESAFSVAYGGKRMPHFGRKQLAVGAACTGFAANKTNKSLYAAKAVEAPAS